MYNVALLRAGFSGVVGLLQSNIPGVPVIVAPLTDSSSGIYVQDKHPLVSLENCYFAAPDFNPNNYTSWASGRDYILGASVNDNGVLYISKAALINDVVRPSQDPSNWDLFNPFQYWLQQKFNQAVSNLFSEVVKLFKLQDLGKAIIERQQLFRGAALTNKVSVPDGSAVGFEIAIQPAEALMVQIDKLGTWFVEDQDLDFYMYNSSQENYLHKFTIEVGTSGGSFKWDALINAIITYMQYDTESTTLLVYYEADLTPGNAAVIKDWDCGTSPCAACDSVDLNMYNRWSRYTSFRNIKIPASGLDLEGRTLPNMKLATIGTQTNWGLNFSLTVRCDLTDFILYSKTLYADALAMQLALEFLRSIAQSSRIEPAMSQIKIQARAELNITEKSTFINQYWNSVNALKVDMSGFSDACQPCEDKGSSGKWRTV